MDTHRYWHWTIAVSVAALLVLIAITPGREEETPACVHWCAGLVKSLKDADRECFKTPTVTYIMI